MQVKDNVKSLDSKPFNMTVDLSYRLEYSFDSDLISVVIENAEEDRI
jgi:hypothetical protein